MSKKEFEELIKSILLKTGLTQEQLSLDSGRNKGYISQVLSRGNPPKKYVDLLKVKYLGEGSHAAGAQEYDAGLAIKEMRAITEVTLSAVAELLARQNGSPVMVVKSQLKEMVEKRMNSAELEL